MNKKLTVRTQYLEDAKVVIRMIPGELWLKIEQALGYNIYYMDHYIQIGTVDKSFYRAMFYLHRDDTGQLVKTIYVLQFPSHEDICEENCQIEYYEKSIASNDVAKAVANLEQQYIFKQS